MNELVAEPLAVHLADHVAVIVMPQSSAQLLVIHVRFVFPGAPQLRRDLGVVQLELALVPQPVDPLPVLLVRQQVQAVVAATVAGRWSWGSGCRCELKL